MKKWIVLLILLLTSPCLAADGVSGVTHPAKVNSVALPDKVCGVAGLAGGSAYSDILFYWGAESTTAEKSGGDSTATLVSGANIDTAIKIVGLSSLGLPNTYDYATFDYSSGVINVDIGRIGFYFYVTTWGDNGYIFQAYADADNAITIYTFSGDQIRFLYESNGAATNTILETALLSPETWYFIEYAYDRANDSTAVYVNGAAAGTSSNDMGTGWTAYPTVIKWGNDGGAVLVYNIDQMIISNDNTRDLNAIKDVTDFD